MIILMNGAHYDQVFKPYDQDSPVIPVGSPKVDHLLHFLRISEDCWSYLKKNFHLILPHNIKIIKSGEMDLNKELNYLADFESALNLIEMLKTRNIDDTWRIQIPSPALNEDFIDDGDDNFYHSSIPSCAIRFVPGFVAALCYLKAMSMDDEYEDILGKYNLYIVHYPDDTYSQVHDNDTDKNFLEQLIQNRNKLTKDEKKLYNVFHNSQISLD